MALADKMHSHVRIKLHKAFGSEKVGSYELMDELHLRLLTLRHLSESLGCIEDEFVDVVPSQGFGCVRVWYCFRFDALQCKEELFRR
jgi:hypothetical protein